jgi:CTP:molybdopterin cytidylyltransferase MocA
MEIPVLILAAGASRRMLGRDKLLETVGGRPLLRHVVRRAVGCGQPVMVALPRDDTRRRGTLAGLDVRIVPVDAPGHGMAASLRAGLAMLANTANGVLVALADMPDITTGDYRRLITSFEQDPARNIQRATTADGTPGNPVLLPRWALDRPALFQGDRGARDLIRQNPDRVTPVAQPGSRAPTALDTPEDWDAWRNR